MVRTLYDVLCVDPGASQLELKAAYKRRVLEVHPDKVGIWGPDRNIPSDTQLLLTKIILK